MTQCRRISRYVLIIIYVILIVRKLIDFMINVISKRDKSCIM